jgi:hypothetical protein
MATLEPYTTPSAEQRQTFGFQQFLLAVFLSFWLLAGRCGML